MKIAFDATSLPNQPGGAGYYMINLLRALLEIKSGHEFFILTHAGDHNLFNLPDLSSTRLVDIPDLGRGYRLIWEQTVLPGLLKNLGVDLLHSPHYTMPLGSNIPVIVTYHDLTFFLFPRYHTLLKRLFFPFMIRQSARRAAAILTVSENTRRDAIRILGIPAKKINTTPLGYDPQFIRCQAPQTLAEVRQKYHLPDQFILNVGTIEPRKNLSTLLAAFSLLAKSFPELNLVIAGGPGWYHNQLCSEINRLPIRDRIYLTGYIERQDLPSLYSLAKIFVYPSLYEGFGLPVLEAMACGAPVVTSNVSSMPEILGDAGILVPPEKPEGFYLAIANLLQNKEKADHLARQGQKRALDFTWQRTAIKTLETYELTAREHGRSLNLHRHL